MNLNQLLEAIRSDAPVEFNQTMAVIEANYTYTPTAFSNGKGDQMVENSAGQNEGSCKIFAFARLQNLDEAQTLKLFGTYYRDDVLGNPEGNDHANIRNFMADGWEGINFQGDALETR